jgi:transposase-like protein
MAKTFRLNKPEYGPEVERLLQAGGTRRQMERLQALSMCLEGKHTLQQISEAVGRARSRIIEWMRVAREEGIAGCLGRHQGRGRAPQVKGRALSELRQGQRRGRWGPMRARGARLAAYTAVDTGLRAKMKSIKQETKSQHGVCSGPFRQIKGIRW